ncbi:Gamma-crystallin B, partial [Orchesella cincta]
MTWRHPNRYYVLQDGLRISFYCAKSLIFNASNRFAKHIFLTIIIASLTDLDRVVLSANCFGSPLEVRVLNSSKMTCDKTLCLFQFAILIFTVNRLGCEAAKVKFFERNDFQGYQHEETSSENCKNLPYDHQNLNGSIKTNGCIMVYPERDCYYSGFIIRGQQSILWTPQQNINGDNLFKYKVRSFKDCTPLQNSDNVGVDIYKKQNRKGEIVAVYRDMCKCHDLPSVLIGEFPSANLHGNCVKVYRKVDCKGKQWIKYGEHDTTDFRIENDDVEPESDSPTIPTGPQQATQLGKQTFTNDGNAELEEIFEVSKEVIEVSQTELSESLSLMASISTSISSETGSEVSIPAVGKVTQKITARSHRTSDADRVGEKEIECGS